MQINSGGSREQRLAAENDSQRTEIYRLRAELSTICAETWREAIEAALIAATIEPSINFKAEYEVGWRHGRNAVATAIRGLMDPKS